MVASWLKVFCSATTQMSSTKTPTLSHVHTIFRGLQDELKDILCALPNLVSPNIKKGLTDVHQKLSDYYYKFDESPFYTWAAHMYYTRSIYIHFLTFFLAVLNPWISYGGLKADYANNEALTSYLEVSKENLRDYFNENYAGCNTQALQSQTTVEAKTTLAPGSPQKCFTSWYSRNSRLALADKLEAFWALPAEDFAICNPITWWFGQQKKFPNLFRLAWDVLCIPGTWIEYLLPYTWSSCLPWFRICSCRGEGLLRWSGYDFPSLC